MFSKIKIFDNFFDIKDFKELIKLKYKSPNKHEIKVFHNKIDKNGKIKNELLNKDLVKKIHEKYHSKVFSVLKELNPKKANLYDYTDLVLIETGSNYKYPIHDDTPNKLLSGVIYLNPEKNMGTSFYDNRLGKNKKTIDWKRNRGVFFSRKEFETWHSYEGDKVSNRIALVYNLNTYNIKKVYSIEDKSYLLGKLRYKINPYLFEYFKFII